MELLRQLKAFEGRRVGPPVAARDPVNRPMIHHWCDALDDRNPAYSDEEFARASVHGGIVAPPTMLQVWNMPGLRRADAPPPRTIPRELFRLLDEAGFTSVVATNCRQEYRRYLRPGDRLTLEVTVESVSEEKQTALGPGHFLTQRMLYRDASGEEVASMQFRMLRFRPSDAAPVRGEGRPIAARSSGSRRRARPAITRDTSFFWEGLERGVLLIQRCIGCGTLRHPPGPMCPACASLAWDAVESSGRGTVYSFAVAHHPPIPPFEYPHTVGLIELEEGTRIVAEIAGIEPSSIEIGMPVRVEFATVDEELTLPRFRPVGGA